MADGAFEETVREIVERFAALEGPLLPILHAVQDQFGYLPPACVAVIAKGLNLSRAEVQGVISFYPLFRVSPPGKRIITICRAEACQAMGGGALEAHAESALGIGFGETSADGEVTLEPIYCLGNCACAPSMTIDGVLHARVDAKRFDELMGR